MKNLIVSCISIVLIPIISKLLDASIVYGLSVSFGIIFIYSLISFIFGRKVTFGDDYLLKPIKNIKKEMKIWIW